MQIEKWQVHVSRRPERFGGDVFIWRLVGDKMEVLNFNEKGEGVSRTFDRGAAVDQPTMQFAHEEDLRGILAAFMVLGAEMGIKRPDESFAQGKLEAQSVHLEDMRRIAFEGKDRDLRLPHE